MICNMVSKGGIYNDSTKQKTKARSSTEAKLIGIDDKITKIIWMKKFTEFQGFQIDINVIYQDNKSCITLSLNGKESSGKRRRHFNNEHFYFTDVIKREQVGIEYCSSDDMLSDYDTTGKPLIGKKFKKMRNKIMNHA